MPRNWKGRGAKEDRECDGRIALIEIWKVWEENGEQQEKIEGVGGFDREGSERNARREKTKKETTVIMATLTADDKEAERRTTIP